MKDRQVLLFFLLRRLLFQSVAVADVDADVAVIVVLWHRDQFSVFLTGAFIFPVLEC